MKSKGNDIIRRIFKISPVYYNSLSEISITNKLKSVKKSAIELAKEMNWKDWDLDELYSPDHRLHDIPTPYVGPASWKECMQRFGHCVYSVVLFKK